MKAITALPLAGVVLFLTAAPKPDPREGAYRDNNIGVGLLEEYNYDGAATAFRRALSADSSLSIARVNLAIALLYAPDMDNARKEAEAAAIALPSAAQPHYVLGLVAKSQNRPDDAIAEFRKVLAMDPSDVGANVNLGQVFAQLRRNEEALAAFRAASAADPFNITALYNLGITLTRAGQAEEGQKALDAFANLRKAGTGIVFGQSYPDQGRYSEALVSSGAEASLVDPSTPEVAFVDVTGAWLPEEGGGSARGEARGRLALLDYDGDGKLDLFVIGEAGQRLLRNTGSRFVDVTRAAGLDPAARGIGVVAGDVDGDGRPDLLVLRQSGLTLYHNEGEKGFSDVTAAAGLGSAPPSRSAALVDYDHDGDLDIVTGGVGAANRVLRNDGKGVFTDVTEAAGIAVAQPTAFSIIPTDFDNHRDVDLAFANTDGPPMLFQNRRDGSFRDVAAETGLGKAQGRFTAFAAADLNKDSYTDFFLGRSDGLGLLALSDGKLHFALAPVPGTAGSTEAMFFDYDNDGILDLVTLSARGLHLLRNLGARFEDVTTKALPPNLVPESFVAGDIDGDGATDLVLRMPTGAIRILRNQGGTRNHSLAVRLFGRASNRNGIGAKIDIRAGSLRQKLETFAATPEAAPADLVFGLGARIAADAVRVLWPSGTLQTETEPAKVALAAVSIEELDRKPSSCPFLYAWNGSRFGFVTDFMGGGEMGYQEAPGAWNTPIPEEYVRLDSEQLKAKDGRYEVRVTNELEEALFIDRLRLIAVTHPADIDVFPNEGMGEAQRPHKVIAVRGAHVPRSVVDGAGRDQRERLSRVDRLFVDDFPLEGIRGYAKEHALVFDLSDVPGERAVLLLTGWTDYAFSSDTIAANQRGLSLKPPSLQVLDDQGHWLTVEEDIGIPVGRPQTVVVPLGGVWRGQSRLVRITTSMRVYWDRALVGESVDASFDEVSLDAVIADLRDRGFSEKVSPDGKEPYLYDYDRVSRRLPWKLFPGRYTRLGDVRELIARSDDVFVISRPGDELALSFDAARLPPIRPGWKRTFLLHADGFSKEMDINSATPYALAPLPFHGMTRYPYSPPEAYPMTEEKLALMERYDTRVVPEALPSLEAALTAALEAGR